MTLIQSGEPKGSLLVQIRKIKGETNMPKASRLLRFCGEEYHQEE